MILQEAKTARPLLLIELFNSKQQQTTNRKEEHRKQILGRGTVQWVYDIYQLNMEH